MSIGSVSVDVVPSAKGFWVKFKAQTQAEGRQVGDQLGRQVADGIGRQGDKAGDEFSRRLRNRMEAALKALPKAKIDADLSPAERQLALLRADLAGLDKSFEVSIRDDTAIAALAGLHAELSALTKDKDIRVRVNASAAVAELEKLRADLGLVPDEVAKSEKEFHLLRNSIVTLGPALIPLAGAVTAVGAGLAALGVTGVAAIFGVKHEMQDGTKTGLQYKLGLDELKTGFQGVASTAAKATLPGFQSAVVTLHTALPEINKDMAVFGSQLGSITAHSISGLVNGFGTFETLLAHVGENTDILAGKFEAWSTGPGGAKFAAELGRELDQVGPPLAEIAEAVGHVVAAFAPVGGTVLTVVGDLGKAINAIPLPVLEALAVTLVSFNSAKLVSGIFDKLAGSLGKVGAEGAAASGGLGKFRAQAAGLVSFAGTAAAAGLAVYTVGKAISNYTERNNSLSKAFDNSGKAQETFFNALTRSNGAIDGGVKSTVQYQLEQDKLVGKAAKAGITEDQLTTAVTGTDQQFQALIDTWRKSGKPSGDTLIAAKLLRDAFVKQQAAAKGATYEQLGLSAAQAKAAASAHLTAYEYLNANDALTKQKDQTKAATDLQKLQIAQNYQLMGTQDRLATRYGITTSQVQSYAAQLGITQDQVEAGKVSASSYANAVTLVTTAYNNADAAGTAFLSAQAQFAQSTGSSADRAALIGATLRAASGDALGYAGTLNQAAVAQKTFGDNIKTAASEVGKNGESTRAYLASVVNLKTGVIDYNNAAAAPLITGLQSIQDAQIAAAQATYQHELSTKGGVVAADDAYNQYVARTGPQLEDQLTKLGLNKTAAHNLAKEYLGVPADVKSKIEQEGGDTVVNVLQSIRGIMLAIAGTKVHPKISIQDNASTQIEKIHENLAALHDHTIDITTYVNNVIRPTVRQGHTQNAKGTSGLGEGWFTVGEGNANTWELGHKSGAHVEIFSNKQSKQMLPGGPSSTGSLPAYAGGTVGGIRYTTDVSYQNALVRAQQQAGSKQQKLSLQQAQIRLVLDTKGLPGVLRQVTGTTAGLNSSLSTLMSELRSADKAGLTSSPFVKGIAAENARLLSQARQRDVVASRFKTANQKLADVQGKFNDEVRTVAAAVTGTFDITNAGKDVFGKTTAAGVINDLQGKVNQASTFATQLASLSKKGLSKTALQQLAEAGPGQSAAPVTALNGASSAQIKQFDALFAKLGSLGTAAGRTEANSLYGAGVNAAKGLVAGLRSQEKALQAQMKRLADTMVNQIKKDLKIHSPSLVGRDLGAFFGKGVALGISDHQSTVARAASGLASVAIPRRGGDGANAPVTNNWTLNELSSPEATALAVSRRQAAVAV